MASSTSSWRCRAAIIRANISATRCRMNKITLFAVLFAISGSAQAQTASIWDGVYSEAQAARGEAGFSAQCARCHGANLGGTGEAPALAGPQFLSDFDGLSLGDLFDRIRTTMPQDNPASLTRDQAAEILAFLLKT